jgi:hypothetical protein
MSQVGNCNCPCPDPEVVEVPGSPGEDGAAGAAGTNGINAFTVTTAAFNLPAAAGPLAAPVTVGVSSWMSIGQVIIVSDGTDWAHIQVNTIPSATSFTGTWLDYDGDAAGTTEIGNGSTVSPSGVASPLSAALPNALTDNSTGTASDTIAAGVGVTTLMFAVNLASLTTLARELVTDYVPGYAFKILAVDFAVTDEGTGAGATQTINLEINSTNLTGGVINPTLANTATAGALVAGTAVTANNTGNNAATISIEVAAGGTIFTAGTGIILVKIQNTDTANAFASLADHINDLITALT